MKRKLRRLSALMLVLTMLMPCIAVHAEYELPEIELDAPGGEYVDPNPEALGDLSLDALLSEDASEDLAEPEPIPFYVKHMMYRQEPEEPEILIADPEVFYAMPGDVIRTEEVGFPEVLVRVPWTPAGAPPPDVDFSPLFPTGLFS